ncbi:MAG: hypothetical protein CVV49_06390 [Spirochaetae bacterium HGW-Spirochaetae-5]|nr:MAG: hypothetical protein CVV49_06390 [Spirochaetae bacterium HGW-Spirochaetae-5]
MKSVFRLNIILFSALVIISPVRLFSQGKQTVVIDTPTAFTIAKGTYKVSFLEYDNGGMEFKTFLGLHDIFYLGVSLDVQSAIGRDDPQFNVPGVIGKVKFNDGWEVFPIALAAGYDSFYVGYDGVEENPENEMNRVIYGPYFVLTGSIYLFDSEQYLSAGVRLPAQPYYKPENTSYFSSLDIPLGEFFRFQFEIERVYWNFKRNEEWLYNAGLKYNYFDHVGFEIAVIMQEDQRPNRIIRIEYHGEF